MQDASRDQKELATEVTSKKLCRCVWLMTSVDLKYKARNVGDVLACNFLFLGKIYLSRAIKDKGNLNSVSGHETRARLVNLRLKMWMNY